MLAQEITWFVSQVRLGRGIAANKALSENLFVSLVCVATRTPLIIVGQPGSSKSLSIRLLRETLAAETKSQVFNELGFLNLLVVFYQYVACRSAQALHMPRSTQSPRDDIDTPLLSVTLSSEFIPGPSWR